MNTSHTTATGPAAAGQADHPAVVAEGVTKRFGRTVAVDHLDLALGRGVIGLLGPNGAGKTTLLRTFATVLAPDAGQVRLLGLDPARPTERLEIRRRLGYLPQRPELYRSFTAFEVVEYVAILKEHTDRRRRAAECRRVLELVGLADLMHRRVRTLSGGMQQRVALAASLLGTPDLLVLDEPATGLDPEQRLGLRSLLAETASHGTVVLSTHNTAEVAALCTTVVVMTQGAVVFAGTPAELTALAEGRVWESEVQEHVAARSWMTASGTYRHLGTLPVGTEAATPTLDDGYLLAVRGIR
ncbi:ATP-binding cassette domain-containing protein [Nocardioides sp. GY 10113]|uniref:ABC transporter ATP-binding protein n=1 Tax=Nocardioides sp. GY 10113 TaxID=2569761 RepID=UPI00197D96F9|nr:ATP-binding cassette domain-containing protein [Nocardioides sp. GY 10113]